MMNVQCLCDEGAVLVCARVHERYYPIPPHPPHPTPPAHRITLKGYCVADEGNMVSQLRENQGRFGVTSEGDLVS